MLMKNGIRNIKKYCREPIESIPGYHEAITSHEKYDCHHINELTFTKDELIKMNMYYNRPASELVLITHSEHMKLHLRQEMPSNRFGKKNPRYGMREENCPAWKGIDAGPHAKYIRARKLYRNGEISESEFQQYKDIRAEYERMRRNP
jgi:hypothetical protein